MSDNGDREVELFGPTHEGAHPVIEHEALHRLRSFCALLPETTEINPFGHPTFRVATKAFVTFELRDGVASILFKIDPELQAALVAREGFVADEDTGHKGWTIAILDEPIDWNEIDGLVIGSYRLVAPAPFIVELDRLLGSL